MQTTTIGNAIITKTLTAHCDGECGGTIVVTTDVAFAAHAQVRDPSHPRFVGGEVTSIDRLVDEDMIVVSCAAQDPLSHDACTGGAAFDRATINASPWGAATSIARHMQRMYRS